MIKIRKNKRKCAHVKETQGYWTQGREEGEEGRRHERTIFVIVDFEPFSLPLSYFGCLNFVFFLKHRKENKELDGERKKEEKINKVQNKRKEDKVCLVKIFFTF